jgi:multicomponent Na+:H+ antiporter subunit D
MNGLHPALVLFATAALTLWTRGRLRQMIVMAGTLGSLLALWSLTPQAGWEFGLFSYTLHLLHVDALSHVFGLIFCLSVFLGAMYALHRDADDEAGATLVYAGAGLGVVFAGDWITLFAFWELMAVASAFVVWYGGTPRARAAGLRYLLVHIFGGALTFCGILLHLSAGGAMRLEVLSTGSAPATAAFWLILLGMAINAAIPPLHAWLTDAYPEASVTGSVFLSAFTTKAAVYVLIRLFPGTEVLLWAGTIMALYGVIYAIVEKNMRRLLSYHIVSQVGYMVAGVGLGTPLALNGATAHAFCHILYKALLFMGTGAVIQATGKRTLSELGGIARRLWPVVVFYMIAAFSISGVPLFNGFISKSIIISAAAEAHRPIPELLLTLASVGTFLSVGLKLPYLAFCGPDRGVQTRPLPGNMHLSMGLTALLCIGLGVHPAWLYARLPFAAEYHPYTMDHVISSLQLFLGTGVGFWLMLDRLRYAAPVHLDTDWVYRVWLATWFTRLITAARNTGGALVRLRTALLRAIVPYARNPFLLVGQWGLDPRPAADRTDAWRASAERQQPAYDENRYRLPIGVTVFWIIVFFAAIALHAL